ncbi:MAG: hypothetical protein L0H19_01330 [Salinisphaera sp.]|nr:hypothetical protein [Salinisphaera sp.]
MRQFLLLDVGYKLASEAAKFRRYSRIRIPDALIWGSAVAHKRTLLTRNTRDFNPDDARVLVPYRL